MRQNIAHRLLPVSTIFSNQDKISTYSKFKPAVRWKCILVDRSNQRPPSSYISRVASYLFLGGDQNNCPPKLVKQSFSSLIIFLIYTTKPKHWPSRNFILALVTMQQPTPLCTVTDGPNEPSRSRVIAIYIGWTAVHLMSFFCLCLYWGRGQHHRTLA